MTKEKRIDLEVYKPVFESNPLAALVSQERQNTIIIASAKALKHFFDTGVYGNLTVFNPDIVPGYWPDVRYLTFDILRPRFKMGCTQFTNWLYNDNFLNDLTQEAREIAPLLPTDITHLEWKGFVDVSSQMLNDDKFFTIRGLVSEKGRLGLQNRAFFGLLMLMEGKDPYEEQWKVWKEKYGLGPL